MAGRPPALDADAVALLGAIRDVGLTQEQAAAALGVSRRTIVRREAEQRRAAGEPQWPSDLAEPLQDVLAALEKGAPPTSRRRRRGEASWQRAARALAHESPERWSP